MSAGTPELVLASASPRRLAILRALGLDVVVKPVALDERRLPDETPRQMVLRLARAKAAAASVDREQLVIGADTAVVLGDEVLGKPRDEADGVDMLLRLSGATHVVLTGVALRGPAGTTGTVSRTSVRFRQIGRDEAIDYWHSGEPADKAGAYGIQGRGGVFVEHLEGSYSGVVGLPVFETAELLRRAGVQLLRNTATK